MDDVFLAISDPTRRAILRLVSGRCLTAGRIAAAFSQQRPAISKHLTVLKRAGLLTETRRRQERLYAIRTGALDFLRIFLAELRGPDDGVIQVATAPLDTAGTSARPGTATRVDPAVVVGELSHNRPGRTSVSDSREPAPPAIPARRSFDLEFD